MFFQQDAIRECMEGYPGDLYEEPFVDFSTTRNYALRVRTSHLRQLKSLQNAMHGSKMNACQPPDCISHCHRILWIQGHSARPVLCRNCAQVVTTRPSKQLLCRCMGIRQRMHSWWMRTMRSTTPGGLEWLPSACRVSACTGRFRCVQRQFRSGSTLAPPSSTPPACFPQRKLALTTDGAISTLSTRLALLAWSTGNVKCF